MTLTPPIGYFGSKVKTSARIIDLLPPHRGYVEPFCGSLSVLLAKPPVTFEVINDIDGDLMTFWRILRDQPDDLARVCSLTPHSRGEYAASWPTTIAGYVDRIERAAARIRRVTLEYLPAVEVIERYGRDPESLLYVDPPYLNSTRIKGIYRHEMGDEASHRDLAVTIHACRAGVVLSGYVHPLYDEDLYPGWDRVEIKTGTGQNARAGYQDRTEVLWSNRPLNRQLPLDLTGGTP